MLWFVLLQLMDSVHCFPEAEHEARCSSSSCFTLHLDTVAFSNAQQNCEDNGGYLMTVRDRHQNNLLHFLLSHIQGQPQDTTLRFWIGLKLNRGRCVLADRTLRGFQWVNGGEDSDYSNWGREPTPTCTQRCVSISYRMSGANHLRWTDGRCRAAASYICKFDFRGMCRALALLGGGDITYTPPFSRKPQKRQMKSVPFGTYADIVCADRRRHYSVCRETDGTFGWTDPGPFCSSGERSCSVNNGGCEGGCRQNGGQVQCVCGDGHLLDDDGLSCRRSNLCAADPCERECVLTETGYTCGCPEGFQLHDNRHNCTDVDECPLQPCAGHLCVNTPGSYTCRCEEGYQLVGGACTDVDECVSSTCDHSCVNSMGSYSCHCHQGFLLAPDRHSCFHITHGCSSAPCEHECTDVKGGYVCSCYKHYKPDSTNPRLCRQYCGKQKCPALCDKDNVDICFCPDGYIKNQDVCQDIDECEMRECDQTCLNTFGSYECSCAEGFVLRKDKYSCASADTDFTMTTKNPAANNSSLKSSSAAAGDVLWIWVFTAGAVVVLIFVIRFYVTRRQKRQQQSAAAAAAAAAQLNMLSVNRGSSVTTTDITVQFD
uniref:Thrombomodulin n=1 Tax=Cynoglossus semilaevis TaxID=244447 RepID=A0A3P8UHL7_CYNSE